MPARLSSIPPVIEITVLLRISYRYPRTGLDMTSTPAVGSVGIEYRILWNRPGALC